MKNPECPKCGSENTGRVTLFITTMTFDDNMTRESMCEKYMLCDDCKHIWGSDE